MHDVSRHNSIFDPVKWGGRRVDVIGVGATGSHLALTLAKLGVQNLHIWDDDKVEEHNLANQVYGIDDIGEPKTEALRHAIDQATGAEVTTHSRWTPQTGRMIGEVVFSMVDSMAVRREIMETYRFSPKVRLILDSRMGATHGQVMAYQPGNSESVRLYGNSLFSDDDAATEVSACGTAITVGPTAQIIAGYLAWGFINHASEVPPTGELLVGAQEPSLVVV